MKKIDYPDVLELARGAKPHFYNLAEAFTMDALEFRSVDLPQYTSLHGLMTINGAVTGWTAEADELYDYHCIPTFIITQYHILVERKLIPAEILSFEYIDRDVKTRGGYTIRIEEHLYYI